MTSFGALNNVELNPALQHERWDGGPREAFGGSCLVWEGGRETDEV